MDAHGFGRARSIAASLPTARPIEKSTPIRPWCSKWRSHYWQLVTVSRILLDAVSAMGKNGPTCIQYPDGRGYAARRGEEKSARAATKDICGGPESGRMFR